MPEEDFHLSDRAPSRTHERRRLAGTGRAKPAQPHTIAEMARAFSIRGSFDG